jgi:alkylhydroperoxidase family enzyme
MALVQTTLPEKAEGKLAELYAEVEQMFGMVPNNVRMLGVSPTPFLAMVRMLVAKACHSPYCQNLNSGLLLKAGFTKEQIAAMQADPAQVPLDEKQKTLLLFVLKACDNPHSVSAEDMDRLRSLGWSEVDVVDAVAHGASMVGTNIISATFKIDRD